MVNLRSLLRVSEFRSRNEKSSEDILIIHEVMGERVEENMRFVEIPIGCRHPTTQLLRPPLAFCHWRECYEKEVDTK